MSQWVVQVRDLVNADVAGHAGTHYTSPPQTRDEAISLVALLVGPTPETDRDRWAIAIAGGRRVVELEPRA
ncbi:hypothetical protein C8N24_0656 [Solirubrobacter pauli]|uniref:Uncharacterized protein n=1 Tax=Solirubrobacter pauli TaxID=166793 RepID=A0A660LDN2_9ACTN|nr:hypothetical protein [Solirubrobacter pauli]RKQ90841.1 hypothetical protein C8N24_0656 [Solirubrobacter pauli]